MPVRHPVTRAALVAVLLAAPLAVPTAASADQTPTVEVSGTLLQVGPEPGSGRTTPAYAVQLADGDIVPVRADFARPPAPHSHFRGRLAVPQGVRSTLAARGQRLLGQTLSAGGRAGQRVLSLVDRSSQSMTVVSSTVTAPTAAAVSAAAATTHRVFIAQPTNIGTAVAASDLLTTARTVASYWRSQSEGAAVVAAPTSVARYSTKVAGARTTCGLNDPDGSDFYDMLDEAAGLFPGFRPDSSDQLVIEVPKRCSDDGALGLGTVGTSFATGGGLIATSDPSLRNGTLAHEMGHNYGLAHANVNCTADGCAGNYAGIFDVMGAGVSGYNQLTALGTPYRVGNGITRDGEVVDGGQSTTLRLSPRSATSGVRSLRLTDPVDGSVYYVDYRSGTGVDAGSAYARNVRLSGLSYLYRAGVVVQREYDDALAPGLVATGNEYRSNGSTIAFGAGQTWTSPAGGLKVRVSTLDATAATVTVPAGGPSGPTLAPVTRTGSPARVTLGSSWPSGTTFGYRWILDGVLVSTASSYVPPRSAQGKALQVAVTGRSGSEVTTRTSPPVTVRPALVVLPRF